METRQQRRAAARGYNPSVGFVPSFNKRIEGAITATALRLQMEGLSPAEAHQKATQQVAQSLPKRRMDYFTVATPTRNNDASYRTGGSITGDGHRAAARAKKVRKPRVKKEKVA